MLKNKKLAKRALSLAVAACMAVTMIPVIGTTARAEALSVTLDEAGVYASRYIGEGINQGRIMNGGEPLAAATAHPVTSQAVKTQTALNNSGNYGGDGWTYLTSSYSGRSFSAAADDYNMVNNFGIYDYEHTNTNKPATPGFEVEFSATREITLPSLGGIGEPIVQTVPASDENYVNAESTDISGINFGGCGNGELLYARIYINQVAALKTMADAGDLRFRFNGWLSGIRDEIDGGSDDHDTVSMTLRIYDTGGGAFDRAANTLVFSESQSTTTATHHKYYDSGWMDMESTYVVELEVLTSNSGGGAAGLNPGMTDVGIFFADTVCPVLNDYSLATNGELHYNQATAKKEVLLKQYGITDDDKTSPDEVSYIDLGISFTEAVTSALPVKSASTGAFMPATDDYKLLDQLANHVLFKNTEGTDYAHENEPVYLKLKGGTLASGSGYTVSDAANSQATLLTSYFTSLDYRWQTGEDDYYGNNPVPNGGDWTGTTTYFNSYSFMSKLYMASLHDAAGNPVLNPDGTSAVAAPKLSRDIAIGTEPEDVLSGYISIQDKPAGSPAVETDHQSSLVSPFTEMSFVIDTHVPTYSIGSNGIQPQILTDMVLNKNDTFFIAVNFSESMVARRYKADGHTATGYVDENTYLEFNNGLKAYYYSGYGTAQWLFTVEVKDTTWEVDTLEVAALANDGHPADTYLMTDYVGNPLKLAAGVEANNSNMNWAGLGVDNTAPVITMTYDADGSIVSEDDWGTGGAITLSAADPALELKNGATAKSRGVYHVANTSMEEQIEVKGMVYYLWVSEAELETVRSALEANNFAPIKRLSLTQTQPDICTGLKTIQTVNAGEIIDIPAELCTPANSGVWYMLAFTSDMTWDSARQMIQYEKVQSYISTAEGLAQYMAWINEYEAANEGKKAPNELEEFDPAKHLSTQLSQASSDAVYAADKKGMEQAGAYARWNDPDFEKDDSNWTVKASAVRVDMTKPVIAEVAASQISGGGTSQVSVAISAADAQSGMQALAYQFTTGESYGAGWTSLSVTQQPAPAEAAGQAVLSYPTNPSGTYDLWVRAVDTVGNESIEKVATVALDGSVDVKSGFNKAANAAPAAAVEGLEFYAGAFQGAAKLPVTNVQYAVSDGPIAPADGYIALTSSGEGAAMGGVATEKYAIPSITGDGLKYVHVRFTAAGAVRYASVSFLLDGTAPLVEFSPSSVGYASEELSVTVSAIDASKISEVKYVWLPEEQEAPDKASELWNTFDKGMTLSVTGPELGLLKGESKSFRLHVYAVDAAGNERITASSAYELYVPAEIAAPTGVAGALKAVEGTAEGGYIAVVEVLMPETIADPGGYEYSAALINSDGSAQWGRWRPYESMISVDIGASPSLSDRGVWVKFRSPTGEISAEADFVKLSNLPDPAEGQLWATVQRSTLKKLAGDGGGAVNLMFTLPETFEISSDPAQTFVSAAGENTFAVTANGYCKFTVSEKADPENTHDMYVVVDNFDSIKPIGTVRFSTLAPTNGNVNVFLGASEDVKVTEIEFTPAAGGAPETHAGAGVFAASENGTVKFTFEDEAGNSASAVGSVTWIDKTPPQAQVVVTYSYQDNTGSAKAFGTIKSGGSVVLSSGAVLTPVATGGKAISVVSGADTAGGDRRVITSDGDYKFIVSDALGNTAPASISIEQIISSIAAPEAQVSYVDKTTGAPLETYEVNGVSYAIGADAAARVTLSGAAQGYDLGNLIYDGAGASVTESFDNTVASGNTKGLGDYACDGAGNYSIARTYFSNGSVTGYVSDTLGNFTSYTFQISGLDKKKPVVTFDSSVIWITEGADVSTLTTEYWLAQEGYRVSDDVSTPDMITVTVDNNGLDTGVIGSHYIKYTAADRTGNTATASRKVYVIPADGILLIGNRVLVSSASSDTAIIDTNTIRLTVDRYKLMDFGTTRNPDGTWNTTKVENTAATYDVFIMGGLYREGQMKYLDTVKFRGNTQDHVDITAADISAPGWYTIIVRNQERQREYTTFLITAID